MYCSTSKNMDCGGGETELNLLDMGFDVYDLDIALGPISNGAVLFRSRVIM